MATPVLVLSPSATSPELPPASAPVFTPAGTHDATVATVRSEPEQLQEPPRLVAVGAHEDTFEWKGRRVVYRHLPLNDQALKCAVYAEGELKDLFSFSSLSAQLTAASASVKTMNIVHFMESRSFRDKSRWVTRIFYTYSRNRISGFL